MENFIKNLNNNELSVIYDYTIETYKYISDYYRMDKKDPDLNDHISTLKDIFSRIPSVKEEIIVYRGTRRKPDSIYVDKGYVSTTLDPAIAKTIASKYFLKILIKEGVRILPIYMLNGRKFKKNNIEITFNSDEQEILIDRDGKYELIDVRENIYFMTCSIYSRFLQEEKE